MFGLWVTGPNFRGDCYRPAPTPTAPTPAPTPAPTGSGGYSTPAPAPSTEGFIDCEGYDSSCRKYGCERDFEGDCLGTFSGKCADYGLQGPNASGDCYR